jgi:TolB-like protein
LHHDGSRTRLDGQPFRILLALLEVPGRVVTREELQHLLWPGDAYGEFESGIGKAVYRLREALHDDADHPRFIETIPRRGYRFIGAVQTPAPVAMPRRALLLGVSTSLAALAAVSLWLFLANRPAPITSIAVLPFANLTGDPKHDPEADALTEALITRISQVASFQRVISRSSVMRYKSTKTPLPEIARALRVEAIVEGALNQSGGRVQATVRLVQAASEQPLWTQSYDRPANEILSLQHAIAMDLGSRTRALLPADQLPAASTRRIDPEAYRAFTRGAPLCSHWGDGDWSVAVAELESALRRESDYADALASLSLCRWQQLNKGGATPGTNCGMARDLALRALGIDPDLALAHAVLGLVRMTCEWDWPSGESSVRKALKLAPTDPTVLYVGVAALGAIGRTEEALQIAKRNEDLSPGSAAAAHLVAFLFCTVGRYEEALGQLKTAVRLDPGNPWYRFDLSLALTRLGRLDEARREWVVGRGILPAGKNSAADIWALAFQVASGDIVGANRLASDWVRRSQSKYVDPVHLAGMYSVIGNRDLAYHYLEIAHNQRAHGLFWLAVEPCFEGLRADRRFQSLLRRMNFPT